MTGYYAGPLTRTGVRVWGSRVGRDEKSPPRGCPISARILFADSDWCRRLISALGGDLDLRLPSGPSRGLLARITLPMAAARAGRRRPRTSAGSESDSDKISAGGGNAAGGKAKAGRARRRPSPAPAASDEDAGQAN